MAVCDGVGGVIAVCRVVRHGAGKGSSAQWDEMRKDGMGRVSQGGWIGLDWAGLEWTALGWGFEWVGIGWGGHGLGWSGKG